MIAAPERLLRADAERNRRRIIEAADRLFARRGVGVTMNDIAREAGVGAGTVYRRFPDLRALIDALFTERFGTFRRLAAAAAQEPDPGQASGAGRTSSRTISDERREPRGNTHRSGALGPSPRVR